MTHTARSYRFNVLAGVVVFLFFTLLLGYIYFETRIMLSGPQLTVEAPTNATTVSDPMLAVHGTSKNVASLSINGTPVAITTEGAFQSVLLMAPGYNTIVLTALDTLGRETSEVLTVVYSPTESSQAAVSPAVISTLTNQEEVL